MQSSIRAALALSIGFSALVSGGLVNADFLNPGDRLLVTDTVTTLQWLAPIYTQAHAFDDAFVQNIINTYGFVYADEPTVLTMISSNFNNPPINIGSGAAGFVDAGNFFNVFGINDPAICGGPPTPCPRTQGLTSTSQSAGSHDAVGMIQFLALGWVIAAPNPWPDSGFDRQMGSWLVRQTVTATPEPTSWGLITLGFGTIIALRRQLMK